MANLENTLNDLIVQYTSGVEVLVPDVIKSLILREQLFWLSIIGLLGIGFSFAYLVYQKAKMDIARREGSPSSYKGLDLDELYHSFEAMMDSDKLKDEDIIHVQPIFNRSHKDSIEITYGDFKVYTRLHKERVQTSDLRNRIIGSQIAMSVLGVIIIICFYRLFNTFFTHAWVLDYLSNIVRK